MKQTATIRFTVSISLDAYSHWAVGLGDRGASEVVREVLAEARATPEEFGSTCKLIADNEAILTTNEHAAGENVRMAIDLPADEWANTLRSIESINGKPVKLKHLLAALILESESWKQLGKPDAEYKAGWEAAMFSVETESVIVTTESVGLASKEFKLL